MIAALALSGSRPCPEPGHLFLEGNGYLLHNIILVYHYFFVKR